jgi:hypothetical protein
MVTQERVEAERQLEKCSATNVESHRVESVGEGAEKGPSVRVATVLRG